MLTERCIEEGVINICPPLLLFGSNGSQVFVGKKPAFTEVAQKLAPHAGRQLRLEANCQSSAPSNEPPSANSSTVNSTSSPVDVSVPGASSIPRGAHIPIGIGIGLGSGACLGQTGAAKAVNWLPFFPTGHSKQSSKTILIMMSNTGGGHKASAEALAAAFQELYGNKHKIHIVDMWKEHTKYPFSTLPDSYSFLVKHAILWRLSYEISQPKWFHIPYLHICGLFCAKGVNDALDLYQPDLVVSVHPLMQHIPLAVIKQRAKQGQYKPIQFATVVTDFTTCHNTWFHRDVSKCFVATSFCRDLAIKNGLRPDQIVMHGLPIRPVFSKRLPSKKAMKKRLKLDTNLPAVLLVGGGEGMGKLEETVRELHAQVDGSCQVVVICGRNEALKQRLAAWAAGCSTPCTAVGFVDNVHEWMAACDLIVTKAGPGTIAEALISGLPILLNGNVPCQEEGNIPYVVDNAVGAFQTQPRKIAALVKEWLGAGREEFNAMAARSKALGRPEAVYDIVRDLAALCESSSEACSPSSSSSCCSSSAAQAGSMVPLTA